LILIVAALLFLMAGGTLQAGDEQPPVPNPSGEPGRLLTQIAGPIQINHGPRPVSTGKAATAPESPSAPASERPLLTLPPAGSRTPYLVSEAANTGKTVQAVPAVPNTAAASPVPQPVQPSPAESPAPPAEQQNMNGASPAPPGVVPAPVSAPPPPGLPGQLPGNGAPGPAPPTPSGAVTPATPPPFPPPTRMRPSAGPAPAGPIPPAGQPAAPRGTAKRGEVSFNFDDADVFSVIQTIFGGVLRVNYIIDPKVKGRVNFRSVSPVAKEDVMPLMEVILRLNGIGVVEDGGLYRIIPIGDMPREPAQVGIGREPEKIIVAGLGLLQVVPLKFIPSSEMVRVLTPFLSTNAVIVDVPKINYIIIVDTDANVKRLLHLVEIFDSEKLKQIKPQVFVYPVRNGKAKDVAAMLQQIFIGGSRAGTTTPSRPTPTAPTRPTTPGQPAQPVPTPAPAQQISLGAPGGGESLVSDITRIIPDEITNTIVILATPDDYALMFETLQKIDIVPRQVMIEVLIAEVTLGDDLQFGIEWSIKAKVDKGFVDFGFNSSTIDASKPIGFTFLGIDKTGLIRGFLQALASESKLNILASPHILAADNREARIQIGQQVPIVTTETPVSTTGTTGTSISRTIQYKDTGVILKIKPLINESGLVSLDLSQEVSDYFIQALYGSEYPVITKREATTNLVAQDGETIVIGGLIGDTFKRTKEGLPLLSQIPLIGYLFGTTKDENKRNEIIMLLTPTVVKNQDEAKNMTNVYVHRLRGVKKDLRIDQLNWFKKLGDVKEPPSAPNPAESVPPFRP
jgi:type II secretory pathway component GspD/PulD (secretin)